MATMANDEKKTKKELIAELQVLRKRVADLESQQFPHTLANEKALDELRGNETLLVVDDNEIFRKFILHTLNLLGYVTLEAENASEAIQLIQDHEGAIDLILTDIVMPDMSGKELVEQLKPYESDIKLIYMSGYAEDMVVHKDVFQVIDDGASFLKKPFSPIELAKKIKHELTVA